MNQRPMGSNAAEEQRFAFLGKTLKEGERILGPTRRPDGTLRKPIRIRAGYVPQDEVAIYQSKGALLRKASAPEVVPPGYDPILDVKPKTKAAKRNERKKEKKQAALSSLTFDKDKSMNSKDVGGTPTGDMAASGDAGQVPEPLGSVVDQMNKLTVSETSISVGSSGSMQSSNSGDPILDIDKKIRAVKKKIRLAEQLQNVEPNDLKPEQLDKLAKLEGWYRELRLLEDKKDASVL